MSRGPGQDTLLLPTLLLALSTALLLGGWDGGQLALVTARTATLPFWRLAAVTCFAGAGSVLWYLLLAFPVLLVIGGLARWLSGGGSPIPAQATGGVGLVGLVYGLLTLAAWPDRLLAGAGLLLLCLGVAALTRWLVRVFTPALLATGSLGLATACFLVRLGWILGPARTAVEAGPPGPLTYLTAGLVTAGLAGLLTYVWGLLADRHQGAVVLIYLVGLVGGLLLPKTAPAQPVRDQPEWSHVVLITVDGLRADAVFPLTAPATGPPPPPWTATWRPAAPGLIRMGERGVVAERAYAAAAWDQPALQALLSPPAGAQAPTEGLSLPHLLRAQGYATHAVLSGRAAYRTAGLTAGFDTTETGVPPLSPLQLAQWSAAVRTWPGPSGPPPPPLVQTRAETVVDAALRWISLGHRPFFLWLHFTDPLHLSDPSPPVLPLQRPSADPAWVTPRRLGREAGARERAALRAAYLDRVAALDGQVNRFLRELQKRELWNRSLVVCAGATGVELWDHEGVGTGHALSEAVVRVPLLLTYWGRVVRGRQLSHPVSLRQVAPTILDLLGTALPPAYQGQSLRGLLDGSAETPPPPVQLGGTRGFQPITGVVTPEGKALHFAAADRWEVYRPADDPWEQRDLARVEPDLLPRLRGAGSGPPPAPPAGSDGAASATER